jgi:hypothetical protein
LENFVRGIEEALAGQAVSIESNVKEFSEDGVQLAEFDLIVSGRLGSAEIQVLIECRDRPGSGSAPRSWIEQMIGRRLAGKFSHVIAVSTSGFSEAAKILAVAQKIEIRQVDRLDSKQVGRWIAEINFNFQQIRFDHFDASLDFHPGTSSRIRRAADKLLTNLKSSSKVFVRAGNGEISLREIFERSAKALHGEFCTWDVSAPVKIDIDFSNESHRTWLRTRSGLALLSRLSISARCTMQAIPMETTTKGYYDSGTGKTISETIGFKLPVPDGELGVDVHLIPDGGTVKVAVSTQSLPTQGFPSEHGL